MTDETRPADDTTPPQASSTAAPDEEQSPPPADPDPLLGEGIPDDDTPPDLTDEGDTDQTEGTPNPYTTGDPVNQDGPA